MRCLGSCGDLWVDTSFLPFRNVSFHSSLRETVGKGNILAKLKKADFYYGAILSHLVHGKICPALIEGGTGRRVYEFTTNSVDFRLFAKYRANPIDTKCSGYNSWNFAFLSNEIAELRGYIGDERISR